MATKIDDLSSLNAFPVVRGNTRTTRSFTEQNVANLISNLFVDMSKGDVQGFTVCEHDNNKVLFNLAGRFFDYEFTRNQNLWFGVYIESDSGEISDAYYSTDDDFGNLVTHKIHVRTSGNVLLNQIHLYAKESAQGDNAYQTKSQIANSYAPKTDVTDLTNRVTAIENINTIDGGTIS